MALWISEPLPKKTYVSRTLYFSSLVLIILGSLTSFVPFSPVSVAKAAPTPGKLDQSFGISVGENLMGFDITLLNKKLDNIVAANVGWIRFDIDWAHVQSVSSLTYDWSNIDKFVDAANAHHLSLLAVIDYTPFWARSTKCLNSDRCPPADPAKFAAFAKTAVLRYGPKGVIKWEIWNEPNLKGDWADGANAAEYAALLKPTYTSIKAAQASAGVIIGGLGPAATNANDIAPIDFLTQLYANGAKNYFNGVGFHPYSYPADPSNYQTWSAWSQMSQTPVSLRSVMTANGDTPKHIWMTEYGAPTNGPGNIATDGHLANYTGRPDHVTEALQAEMISEAVPLVRSYSWAGPLFVFTYMDFGTDKNNNQNFFGLYRYDGSSKPSYTTLKNSLQ